MPTIRVDEAVLAALKARAEPFRDTPNLVLRRLLGLDRAGAGAEPAFPGAEPAAPEPRDPMAWNRLRWEIAAALFTARGEDHAESVVALAAAALGVRPGWRDADNRAAARREGARMLADGLIEAADPHHWRLTALGRRYFVEALGRRATPEEPTPEG